MIESCGLLLWHPGPDGAPQVLLGHMGGPYWTRKEHAWSIPKGEREPAETASQAARREFAEEIGPVPDGELVALGSCRAGAKLLTAFALLGGFDPAGQASSTFTLEWPPRSGRTQEFPEIDRAAWFGLESAREHIVRGQLPILDRFSAAVAQLP